MNHRRLDYRYRLTFTVVVEGDGQHADGFGARATRDRLRKTLAHDRRVIEVRPVAMPVYIGAKPASTQDVGAVEFFLLEVITEPGERRSLGAEGTRR